jgi:nitrogen fixation NifU-like protein/NifU-like protein
MKQQKDWIYSETVRDHFFHPRNILLKEPKKAEFDAEGEVGNPACGDVMKMWLKIDPRTKRIKKLKWRTFGCASAIASTSMFSQMVVEKGGMKLEDALKITPQDIMKRLGGLPPYKVHCSVLADRAFKAAAKKLFEKNNSE